MKPALSRAAHKEINDNARLLRLWKRWHRDRLAEALAGPDGALVHQVLEILHRMTLRSRELLDFVRATDWHIVDPQARAALLHAIDSRVTNLRELEKLPPFSDALPHQPLNGFLVIQKLMTETTPGDPGKTGESSHE